MHADAENVTVEPDSDSANLIERWIEWLLVGKLASPKTAASYRESLDDFCERMRIDAPERVSSIRVFDSYRNVLDIAGYAKATISIRLNGLKSYYGFLKSRGHIEADPTAGLEIPAAHDFGTIPTFKLAEIERMISCGSNPPAKGKKEPVKFYSHRLAGAALAEPRAKAVIALGYACGLRASEFSILNYDDYDGKFVYIRGGKAAKRVQRVAVFPMAAVYMSLYLEALNSSPWRNSPALFPPLFEKQNRVHKGRGISDDAVSSILQSRIEMAGIEQGRRSRMSAHLFRYSIATHLYEFGYPYLEVKRHLRHGSVGVLLRYINQGPEGLPRLLPYRPHPWMKGRLFLPA